MIVNQGRQAIFNNLFQSVSYSKPDTINMGDDDTAPVVTQTDLVSETASRSADDISTSKVAQYKSTWGRSEANGTIKEIGLFQDDYMWARTAIKPFIKSSSFELNVIYKIITIVRT